MVARYADCESVLRSNEFGKDFANSTLVRQIMSDTDGDPPPFLGLGLGLEGGGKLFLLVDPPDHTRIRGLVSRAFTAGMVRRSRPAITAIVNELLTAAGDRFDLISDLAVPLPTRVVGDMLRIPVADQPVFTGWSRQIAGVLDLDMSVPPEVAAQRRLAVAECLEYFSRLIQIRRSDNGDDLISGLIQAKGEGSALTTYEIAAVCILLMVAGQEITSNLIGNAGLIFSRHPAEFRQLADDPGLVDDAIDEILRLEPPAQVAGRVARERVQLRGAAIEPGDAVIVLIGSANHDERQFADPDRFDPRRGAHSHLSFGMGIHYCLGAPLARMMAQETFTALTRWYSSFSVADEEITYKDGMGLRGPAALLVETRKRGV